MPVSSSSEPSHAAEESNCLPVSRPPSAWIAKVFTQLQGRLVNYSAQRLGTSFGATSGHVSGGLETARDIVQEAFVQLCQQRWPEIEVNATAWLYRTCRNRAIDYQRREARMKLTNEPENLQHIRDSSSPPEEDLGNSEKIDQVRKYISQLSEQQQEILRLRLHDGLRYRQIAEVTGLTVSNVGFQLHQAISKLRAGVGTD